jgi:short-subunit dehydrogenase
MSATSRALVLGARSAISVAIARELAATGWDLVLAARRCDELEPTAADIRLRFGREVHLQEFDALALEEHESLPHIIRNNAGHFDLAIAVFGYMGDQLAARGDTREMERALSTNFVGAAVILAHVADYLETRPGPCGIIGVSSVAGDRGRQSNYVYGSAKAGLSCYLQGLRNRLASSKVHVMTVKPGFVDTPMTEGVEEGRFLMASPQRVATDILRAYRRRRNVLYTPWFWRYIMWTIRMIPESIFKRLKL